MIFDEDVGFHFLCSALLQADGMSLRTSTQSVSQPERLGVVSRGNTAGVFFVIPATAAYHW
jgi:hypothetical protein